MYSLNIHLLHSVSLPRGIKQHVYATHISLREVILGQTPLPKIILRINATELIQHLNTIKLKYLGPIEQTLAASHP